MIQSCDEEPAQPDGFKMNVDESQHVASTEPEPKSHDSGPPAALEPERWVEAYGDLLFGFALIRVRDRSLAQDLVQEAFLAAIKAREGFRGRSTERAWLLGILRHKLADYFRRQRRELLVPDPESPLPDEEPAFHMSGLGEGGWVEGVAPKAWEAPDESLVRREFQETLRGCLSRLPDKVAQVFLMREIDGVPSDEICKDLGVSPNNLWVMLYRARMGLRRCLEVRWFGNRRTGKR